MKSVQVWGDSILKGVVYDDSSNKYVFLKDNALSAAQSVPEISVENYSKFGQTILRAEPKLLKHLQDAALPDVILLELGGNDCDFNWKEVGDAPDDEHQPNTPIEIYRQKLTELLSAIMDKGIKPVIASLPPLDYQRYFNWVTKPADVSRDGVLKWLKTPYTIYSWHESYDRCAKEIAARMDIPVIDVREAFLSTEDYTQLMCSDGIHPNEKGQRLIGETLKSFILNNKLNRYFIK